MIKLFLHAALILGIFIHASHGYAEIGDPVRNAARQELIQLGFDFHREDVCRAAKTGNTIALKNYADAGMDFQITASGDGFTCHDSAYQLALQAGHIQAAMIIENAGGKTEPRPKSASTVESAPPTKLNSWSKTITKAATIALRFPFTYLAWVVNFFLVIPILIISITVLRKPVKRSTFWNVALVCGICLAPSYFGGSHDVLPFPGIFPFAIWFAKPTTDWWIFSIGSAIANTILMYFAFTWLQRRAVRIATPSQVTRD